MLSSRDLQSGDLNNLILIKLYFYYSTSNLHQKTFLVFELTQMNLSPILNPHQRIFNSCRTEVLRVTNAIANYAVTWALALKITRRSTPIQIGGGGTRKEAFPLASHWLGSAPSDGGQDSWTQLRLALERQHQLLSFDFLL